ncbi:hypothetical protein [Micromonospora sp. NPDC126480]|uniref:hypothetical protein n=1 Tax=Micromonospora sp. NPDC126480 TaxID=3155312 RepID=UPI00331C43C1
MREPHRFSSARAAIAWSFIATGRDYFDLSVVELRIRGEFPRYSLYQGAMRDGGLRSKSLGTWPDGVESRQAIADYAFEVFDLVHERHPTSSGYQLRRDHVVDSDVALDRIRSLRLIRDAAGSANEIESRLRVARDALNGAVGGALQAGLGVTQIAAAAGVSRQWIYDLKAGREGGSTNRRRGGSPSRVAEHRGQSS